MIRTYMRLSRPIRRWAEAMREGKRTVCRTMSAMIWTMDMNGKKTVTVPATMSSRMRIAGSTLV